MQLWGFPPSAQQGSHLAGADDLLNTIPNRRFLPISFLFLPFIFIELAPVHLPRRVDTFRLRGAVMRVFDARKPEIEVWSA